MARMLSGSRTQSWNSAVTWGSLDRTATRQAADHRDREIARLRHDRARLGCYVSRAVAAGEASLEIRGTHPDASRSAAAT